MRAKNKRVSCKLFFFLLTACLSKSISKLTPENHEFLLPSFSLTSFSQFGNLFYQNYSQVVRPFIPSANLFMLIRNLSFGLLFRPFLGSILISIYKYTPFSFEDFSGSVPVIPACSWLQTIPSAKLTLNSNFLLPVLYN